MLPAPARHHATCAWCRRDFTTIVALLDHVDTGHPGALADKPAVRGVIIDA
jgi:hypothetical protein